MPGMAAERRRQAEPNRGRGDVERAACLRGDRAGEDVAAAVGQSRDGHELVGDHAADHDEAVHLRISISSWASALRFRCAFAVSSSATASGGN